MEEIFGGGFALAAAPPARIWRGQTVRLRIGVSGATGPAFSLAEGPEGAQVSADGVLTWHCPWGFVPTEVRFRVGVRDPTTGRTLDQFVEAEVAGPLPARRILAGGAVSAEPLPLRVHAVPSGGVVRDKFEVSQGRFHVLLTESASGAFRLEVFDVGTETWLPGAELPSRPDAVTANPQVVYLAYGAEAALGLRRLDDLATEKRIPLQRPLVGIGCSHETTGGALVVIERTDPGANFARSAGANPRPPLAEIRNRRARAVFLSPLDLTPLPVSLPEDDAISESAALMHQANGRTMRIACSPDGWFAAIGNCVFDLGGGRGPVRCLRYNGPTEPVHISAGGASFYARSVGARFDRAGGAQPWEPVYQPADTGFERVAWVCPVAGSDVDLGVVLGSGRQSKSDPPFAVQFRTRSDDREVMAVRPLPELGSVPRRPEDPMSKVPPVSATPEKLVTLGPGLGHLFVRDIRIP
jgi:hypothetical protein